MIHTEKVQTLSVDTLSVYARVSQLQFLTDFGLTFLTMTLLRSSLSLVKGTLGVYGLLLCFNLFTRTPRSSKIFKHYVPWLALLRFSLQIFFRYVDAVLTIPKGTLFPMCGMNLGFNRELIGPAMYFGLMGDGQPIGRYDDMWAGWCVKVYIAKTKSDKFSLMFGRMQS